MKLNEFEEKLVTVGDDKLRAMLGEARRNGPEVALKVILSEATRRGIQSEDAPSPSLTLSAASLSRLGSDISEHVPVNEMPEMPPLSDSEGVPAKGAWLNEEVSVGMSPMLKAGIALGILGLLAGVAYLFLNRG